MLGLKLLTLGSRSLDLGFGFLMITALVGMSRDDILDLRTGSSWMENRNLDLGSFLYVGDNLGLGLNRMELFLSFLFLKFK
jgi:hypothetical protein